MLTLPARRGDRKQVLAGKRPLGAVATLSSTVRPRPMSEARDFSPAGRIVAFRCNLLSYAASLCSCSSASPCSLRNSLSKHRSSLSHSGDSHPGLRLRTKTQVPRPRPYIFNCGRDGQRRNIDNRYPRVVAAAHVQFHIVWAEPNSPRFVYDVDGCDDRMRGGVNDRNSVGKSICYENLCSIRRNYQLLAKDSGRDGRDHSQCGGIDDRDCHITLVGHVNLIAVGGNGNSHRFSSNRNGRDHLLRRRVDGGYGVVPVVGDVDAVTRGREAKT